MSEVINYYTSFGEREWSRLEREPLEFLVNWHYIRKYLPPEGLVMDNGAGPGRYAMELAVLGYRVTLTDLTPGLVQLAERKADELKLSRSFDGFHVANATNLSFISNHTYDASLMLGPLYHLQQVEEREAAMAELNRVTKPGGVVFIAIRSRLNHMLTSLLHPESWKPNNQVDAIERFMETGLFNHADEGRYTGAYFYNVEDIRPFMESHGFDTLELIGSTNAGAVLREDQWAHWRAKGEEEYAKLVQMLIRTASEPSLLGMSSHLLYIGRKR
ncbi:class I SAM-dependent methyltransferase [Paenibacillus sp. GCM10023252]|uniref:class I SAM-dependent methyltransferase n=1 Tax=Paenibacillus sp. GCM10023252 TaxID=3252649 RepID=UPI0036189EE1